MKKNLPNEPMPIEFLYLELNKAFPHLMTTLNDDSIQVKIDLSSIYYFGQIMPAFNHRRYREEAEGLDSLNEAFDEYYNELGVHKRLQQFLDKRDYEANAADPIHAIIYLP